MSIGSAGSRHPHSPARRYKHKKHQCHLTLSGWSGPHPGAQDAQGHGGRAGAGAGEGEGRGRVFTRPAMDGWARGRQGQGGALVPPRAPRGPGGPHRRGPTPVPHRRCPTPVPRWCWRHLVHHVLKPVHTAVHTVQVQVILSGRKASGSDAQSASSACPGTLTLPTPLPRDSIQRQVGVLPPSVNPHGPFSSCGATHTTPHFLRPLLAPPRRTRTALGAASVRRTPSTGTWRSCGCGGAC